MKAAKVSLFSLIAVNKSSVKSAILDIVEKPFLKPPCSLHNKLCIQVGQLLRQNSKGVLRQNRSLKKSGAERWDGRRFVNTNLLYQFGDFRFVYFIKFECV